MPLSGHFAFPRIDGAEREPLWTAADGVDPDEVRRLFQQHGVELLQKLRGPFAIAIWDGETLLLARDGFGHKPLFFAETSEGPHAGELWFGPDPQALKSRGAAVGQIDRDALSDYLELLYVPSPSSIWSGVRKLPAGHLLRCRRRVRPRRGPRASRCGRRWKTRCGMRARRRSGCRANCPPRHCSR